MKVVDVIAFFESGVETVIIPPSCTQIKRCCFGNCESLCYLKIPENSKLEIIENEAFTGTLIENIDVPTHLTKISSFIFSKCHHLKKVEVSTDCELELIEKSAFKETSVEFYPKKLNLKMDGAWKHLKNIVFITFCKKRH